MDGRRVHSAPPDQESDFRMIGSTNIQPPSPPQEMTTNAVVSNVKTPVLLTPRNLPIQLTPLTINAVHPHSNSMEDAANQLKLPASTAPSQAQPYQQQQIPAIVYGGGNYGVGIPTPQSVLYGQHFSTSAPPIQNYYQQQQKQIPPNMYGGGGMLSSAHGAVIPFAPPAISVCGGMSSAHGAVTPFAPPVISLKRDAGPALDENILPLKKRAATSGLELVQKCTSNDCLDEIATLKRKLQREKARYDLLKEEYGILKEEYEDLEKEKEKEKKKFEEIIEQLQDASTSTNED